MRTEELIERISKHEPLLAKAVSHMVAYVQDRYPSTFPSKEQTMAVNEYLHSVHADGDGSMSEANCEPSQDCLTANHYRCHPYT